MVVETTSPPTRRHWIESVVNSVAFLYSGIAFIVVLLFVLPVFYCAVQDTRYSSTNQNVDQLTVGMTQEQVRAIMGQPHSIDRWGTWIYATGCHDPRYIEFDEHGQFTEVY